MRYAWNRPRSVDPAVFGASIERIAEARGGVCPSWALVDEARPAENVLHPMFEWDDWTAAEAYRRDQARHHLRELRVVVQTDDGEEERQALVHVIRLDGDTAVEGYRLTSLIVESADECRQMVDEALAGLRAWRRRYEHLSELAGIWDVIEGVMARRG